MCSVVERAVCSFSWTKHTSLEISKYQSERDGTKYCFSVTAQYIVDDTGLARLLAANCQRRHHNFYIHICTTYIGDISFFRLFLKIRTLCGSHPTIHTMNGLVMNHLGVPQALQCLQNNPLFPQMPLQH